MSAATLSAPPPDLQVRRADYLLAAMRCARLRLMLLGTEIDEVRVALRYRMVTPEHAVQWLDEIGALHLVVDVAEEVHR